MHYIIYRLNTSVQMDTTLQNRFNETRTMMEIKESSQHNQFVTTVGIPDVLFLSKEQKITYAYSQIVVTLIIPSKQG